MYLTGKYVLPTRVVIAVMIFLAGTFAYMLTFNFSISVLAMVAAQPDENGTIVELPDFGPRFAWNAFEQSLVTGAYFYGNFLFSVPAGLFVERSGWAKESILWTFILCTALALLTPLAAGLSFGTVFAVRFLMGAAQGVLFPAYTHLITKWSPPTELGMFMFTNMGSNIGTVLTWSVSGLIVESIGWSASFYITGSIGAVFAICWAYLVFNSPAQHPRIKAAERDMIVGSLHDLSENKNGWPPMWSIVKSVPFWSQFIMQFGNSWGSFFVLTAVPRFLNEILGFQIGSTGFLASVPYLSRTLVSLIFGYISRTVEARYPRVSLTTWRRAYSVFSHIIPGLLFIAVPFTASNPYVCIALITLAYGSNGAVSVVTLANAHDLSPNYATTLISISNGLGNATGFLSPLVVAYFTAERNTIDEWRTIMLIVSAIYIAPALIFAVWGSGLVQPWNEPQTAASSTTDVLDVANQPPAKLSASFNRLLSGQTAGKEFSSRGDQLA